MAVRETFERPSGTGDGGTQPPKVGPPPPPILRVLSLVFALLAVIAGALRRGPLAAVLAGFSLAANLWDFFAQRNALEGSSSSEGKTLKR